MSTAHYVLDKQIVAMKPTIQHSAVWARKTSGNTSGYTNITLHCVKNLVWLGKEHASSCFINELSRFP